MKGLQAFNRALIGLGSVVAIGCMQASPGVARVQDSVFFISPDGTTVAFDVHDVSRREVLDKLLANKANKGILLEWKDAALAEERISGSFTGSIDAVLQRLLAEIEFVVVYGLKGDKSRIGQLTIIGKAAPRPSGLATIHGATPPPVGAHVPVLTAVPGVAGFTPPSAADAAVQLIRPVPAEAAPALVPPSPAERAPLLIIEPATKGQ